MTTSAVAVSQMKRVAAYEPCDEEEKSALPSSPQCSPGKEEIQLTEGRGRLRQKSLSIDSSPGEDEVDDLERRRSMAALEVEKVSHQLHKLEVRFLCRVCVVDQKNTEDDIAFRLLWSGRPLAHPARCEMDGKVGHRDDRGITFHGLCYSV